MTRPRIKPLDRRRYDRDHLGPQRIRATLDATWEATIFRRGLGIFWVLLACTPVSAAFYDGHSLYAACSEDKVMATTYAVGVLDAAHLYQSLSGVRDRVCIEVGVQASQVGEVACNYLEDNPQNRHWLAADVVAESAAAAWPCQ